jgi:hypothetical protein
MTGQSDKPGSIDAEPTAETPAKSAPGPQPARKARRKRILLVGGLGVAVLIILVVFGIPWAEEMLNTVSTDDAFVNLITHLPQPFPGRYDARTRWI